MISLRYHTVSIAAVFLALAVGVVMGSSSVSQALLSGVGDQRDSLSDQVRHLRGRLDATNGELAGARRFGTAVAPLAVRDALAGRSVAVITTPNVDPRHRDAMKELLGSAGASVTGTLRLTDSVTDPARTGQLRDVVTRLLPAGVRLPVTSDPGTLVGGLVGPLTLLDPRTDRPQASPQERAAALAGLTEGGFLRASADFRPAQLAVVLTGGPSAGAPEKPAAMLARLAAQVDRAGAGAVLAGTTGADGSAVEIARADGRTSSELSTVDNAGTAAGRVATVLALGEQLSGQAGHYGVSGSAEGPVPRPPRR